MRPQSGQQTRPPDRQQNQMTAFFSFLLGTAWDCGIASATNLMATLSV